MATRTNPVSAFSTRNRMVTCRMCGKRTHSEIDGHIGLDLCRRCRESAEMENAHLDGHHSDGAGGDGGGWRAECPNCAQERADDAAAGIAVPACVGPTVQPDAHATDAAFSVLRAAVERRAVALARLDAIRAEQVAAVAEFEAATAATVAASDAYSAAVAH